MLGHGSSADASSERRTAERLPMTLEVTMTVRSGSSVWHETDACILDVSQGGLLVRCDRLPHRRGGIVLRFDWHGYGACTGHGSLVRVSSYGGFAARFDRVNWAMQDFLALLSVLGPTSQQRLIAQLDHAQLTIE